MAGRRNLGWMDFLDPQVLYKELQKLDPVERIRVSTELIEVCRDQLMVDLATIRRAAAAEARHVQGMRPNDIAEATGSSRQTISRLLTEAASMNKE